MKFLIIMPAVYKPYADECVGTMNTLLQENLMLWDNTQNNIGVTPAWNNGVDEMYRRGADWLILMSAAIRFQHQGGLDFIGELEKRPDHDVLEALGVFGWHLIAFNRRVFDAVGRFDENMPIYFSDIDWSLRIQKAFHQQNATWDKVEVDLTDKGMAHGIEYAGVKEEADVPILYFAKKWGRHPGAYQLGSYGHPFNDEKNSIKFWPSVGDRSCGE